MQLPDESVTYDYTGLLQSPADEWGAAAELRARHLLHPSRFKDIHQRLMQCRGQVAADREMRNPPPESLPLEPGFINLPQEMLDDFRRKQDQSAVGRIQALAQRLRDEADRVVFLGAGGSHLGASLLFTALKSRHHNELPGEARLGTPRVYFEGDSADNDGLQELLDLLQVACVDPEQREERWAVVTISKSGTSLEPGVAHRVFRREASEYYCLRSPWHARMFAAVTAPSSRMRDLGKAYGLGDDALLPIPENVGGRFAVFTAAGLLPAAVMGLDVRALLLGAAAMTKRFLEEPIERNPVLQFAGLNWLLGEEKPVRAMAAWSRKLAGVGPWYAHLVSETLGKQGRGPTSASLLMTADQHSRGQHLQEGSRHAVVNNLVVGEPQTVPIVMQMSDRNEDDLNQFNRKSMPDMAKAALAGVAQAAWDAARPMGSINLPRVTEHTVGQLLQMLMLATVVEARLMGLNPYGQTGVDAQRRLMYQTLRKPPEPSGDKVTR
ncbi:MAG: glucose-6-phosphate isomerase [Gemmataceae bacterium]|nr:glucose-6-phosphate isomerase [Gemmataceae bacterium]